MSSDASQSFPSSLLGIIGDGEKGMDAPNRPTGRRFQIAVAAENPWLDNERFVYLRAIDTMDDEAVAAELEKIT